MDANHINDVRVSFRNITFSKFSTEFFNWNLFVVQYCKSCTIRLLSNIVFITNVAETSKSRLIMAIGELSASCFLSKYLEQFAGTFLILFSFKVTT